MSLCLVWDFEFRALGLFRISNFGFRICCLSCLGMTRCALTPSKEFAVNESDTIAILHRPRRRLWLWSGLIVAPLILILAWWGYQWHRQREYGAAIEEADRLDPGWRLQELEAARAQIPDAENGALQVLKAKALLPAGWLPFTGWGPSGAGTPSLEEELEQLSPASSIDKALRQQLRAKLAKAAPALPAARQLAEFLRGRYAVIWSEDAIGTFVPHVEDARDVARLLRLDAVQRSEDGDIEGAIISCKALLNTGRSFGDEPMFISQVNRLFFQRMTLRSLERALAHGQASEPALQAIQRALEEEAEEPLLLIGARSMRAGVHQFLVVVEAGQFDRSTWRLMSRTGSDKVDNLWDQSRARGSHAAYLRYLTECVEISKLPPEQQQERLRRPGLEPPKDVPQLMAAMREPGDSFQKQARNFHYRLAFIRSAVTAVAVERYRLANGRWPNQLDELAPHYLRSVPTDPFDGQPLRYRRLKDGVIIYTVGEDHENDGGQRVRLRAGSSDADVGFQLWDPELRRQAPRKE
jgi:hypothetical protein